MAQWAAVWTALARVSMAKIALKLVAVLGSCVGPSGRIELRVVACEAGSDTRRGVLSQLPSLVVWPEPWPDSLTVEHRQ